MVEITPSPVEDNCYINTDIDAGSENSLNRHLSPARSFTLAEHSDKKVYRITMNMLFVTVYRAWELYFKAKE